MWSLATKIATLVVCVSLSSAQNTCPAITGTNCFYSNVALLRVAANQVSPNNHYYIGGLFGVHEKGTDAYQCGTQTRERGIMNMQAFMWAIGRYRDQSTGLSIGGVAFDNCGRQEQAVENVLSFEQCKVRVDSLDRRQLMAFVGPDRSGEAMAIGSLASDLKMTFVSHAATSSMLADGTMYPYFLRTVPSDINDATILAEILRQLPLSPRYFMMVYQDDSYGRSGMAELKKRAEKDGKCVVYSAALPVNADASQRQAIVDQLLARQSAKYVVLYMDGARSKQMLQTVYATRGAAGRLRFLGTSSWGMTTDNIAGMNSVTNNSLVVALTVDSQYQQAVTDFKAYWDALKPQNQNAWFQQYWEQTFSCSLTTNINPCNTAQQSLRNKALDVYVPYTIMAVDVVLNGIKEAAQQACSGRYELCSSLMNLDSRGYKIFEGIKNQRRRGQNVFDTTPGNGTNRYKTGDVNQAFTSYKVYQVVDGRYVEVGTYNPTAGLRITRTLDSNYFTRSTCPDAPCTVCGENPTTIVTTTPRAATTLPSTTTTASMGARNYTMVKFPVGQLITGAYTAAGRRADEYGTRFDLGHKWVLALGVLAGLGILAVIVFEIYILYKLLGTSFGRQWRTMWLGQLLLFGLLLCYLTLIAYIFIPTKATCGITRFGVGVSYAICFAVLLVKLMVILTSKSSDSLIPGDIESPNYLKGIYQFLMFIFAVGVQIVIEVQWLITVPPEAVKVYSNNGEMVWICNHYTWDASNGWNNMTTFVRNEFENHVLSLVYIMFMILITTVLALNAHGIITNHRESIFIGISAGFSIPIWLAWTLVGGLNKDHAYAHEFSDACIAFGLFLTATLILFSMFLPKVRQLVNMGVEGIYFEDDRDTVYGGSVIMAPPSYKSRPNSVIYVNNQNLYSEPIVLGNGDATATHLKHPGSTYSLPPTYLKKSYAASTPGGKTLTMTGDLTGKRPKSEAGYGSTRRPPSERGTLRRSRSQQDLGAL